MLRACRVVIRSVGGAYCYVRRAWAWLTRSHGLGALNSGKGERLQWLAQALATPRWLGSPDRPRGPPGGLFEGSAARLIHPPYKSEAILERYYCFLLWF